MQRRKRGFPSPPGVCKAVANHLIMPTSLFDGARSSTGPPIGAHVPSRPPLIISTSEKPPSSHNPEQSPVHDMPLTFTSNRVHMSQAAAIAKRFHSTLMASSDRSYAAAIQALNSLQSNFAAVEAIRKSGKTSNHAALPAMRDWVRRIGYEVLLPAPRCCFWEWMSQVS